MPPWRWVVRSEIFGHASGVLPCSSSTLLIVAAIPIAVGINGVRVFLTGFLVYFVDPAAGQGAFHRNEGWAMFMIAFLVLGAVAAIVRLGERGMTRPRGTA